MNFFDRIRAIRTGQEPTAVVAAARPKADKPAEPAVAVSAPKVNPKGAAFDVSTLADPLTRFCLPLYDRPGPAITPQFIHRLQELAGRPLMLDDVRKEREEIDQVLAGISARILENSHISVTKRIKASRREIDPELLAIGNDQDALLLDKEDELAAARLLTRKLKFDRRGFHDRKAALLQKLWDGVVEVMGTVALEKDQREREEAQNLAIAFEPSPMLCSMARFIRDVGPFRELPDRLSEHPDPNVRKRAGWYKKERENLHRKRHLNVRTGQTHLLSLL
jgi:hypothetical protein